MASTGRMTRLGTRETARTSRKTKTRGGRRSAREGKGTNTRGETRQTARASRGRRTREERKRLGTVK